MYPGYSPADHVYGQAAMQYGSAATKAKAEGIELKPHPDLEYELGQGKGTKRTKLADIEATKGLQGNSVTGSGSGADAPSATNGTKLESEKSDAKDEEMGDAAQPSFYIDYNPTPINLPFNEKNDSKRATSVPEPVEESQPKKAKKAHNGELPAAPAQGKIETEDITAEVDARMKEKEEKRLRKEEKKRKKEAAATVETVATEEADTSVVAADDKKRKRDSAGSSASVAVADAPAVNGEEVKKPKKKKSKKEKDGESNVKVSENTESPQTEPQKNSEPAQTGSQKSDRTATAQDESQKSVEADGKKKKKKAKKEKDIEPTVKVNVSEDTEPAQSASKKRSKEEGGDGEGKKKRKKRKLEGDAAAS